VNDPPARISLHDWDLRYASWSARGLRQTPHGGRLSQHVADSESRLQELLLDHSTAALRLWDFVLGESQRLFAAETAGKPLVATMRDVGVASVIAASLPDAVVFRPDAAWCMPLSMETGVCDALVADRCGIDASFCPARSVLGAMLSNVHFPPPRLLVCSAGAACDDFTAIAQRLESLGHPVCWWEMPRRRNPASAEPAISLPAACTAPASQVAFVRGQLGQLVARLEQAGSARLDDSALFRGISAANRLRRLLGELLAAVAAAPRCPLPALETAMAELLAIHGCSDRDEAAAILENLLEEVRRRMDRGEGVVPDDAVRVFWVNPVVDLSVLNLLEQCGGRLCGSDCLFCQAAEPIPDDLPPLEALARSALADPVVGPLADRARRICERAIAARAEVVVISRIPAARHCALDALPLRRMIGRRLDVPVVQITVPSEAWTLRTNLRPRLQGLIESARRRPA